MIEVIVFSSLVIIYICFREKLAGKIVFILPTMMLCIMYVYFLFATEPNILKEFGLRIDNIIPTTKLTAILFLPFMIILLLWGFINGFKIPPFTFYVSILFYPLWGVIQQFIFQSFFHTRLIKLGTAPLSILLVAFTFAVVHLPSIKLVFITFIGGLISSFIFLKQPNIIPLGISHGILGAIYYYLILEKDVLKSFLKN